MQLDNSVGHLLGNLATLCLSVVVCGCGSVASHHDPLWSGVPRMKRTSSLDRSGRIDQGRLSGTRQSDRRL